MTGTAYLLAAGAVLVWAGALTAFDLRERRLPDGLTLPAVPVVWGLLAASGHGWAVLGGVAWFLLCVLPGQLSARLRAGGGDAKLALSLGAVAAVGGVPTWLLTVAVASVVTLVLALVPGVRGGASRTGPACSWPRDWWPWW